MGRLGSANHVREVLRLYRGILRLQRGLPKLMQRLKEAGTPFIRDEFRRHSDVKEQKIVDDFMREWTEYTQVLARQLSLRGIAKGHIGRNLDPEEVSKLSDEHAGQLYELKRETEKPKAPSS